MLFMAEFWERFAFYGIRWALTLYIVAQFYDGDPSGQQPAGLIYGSYLALVYAGAILGGYVADKYVGYQRSILIGAVVMAVGLFLIAVPNEEVFKRSLQADHLDTRRQALLPKRRAPRLGLHDLLHGHQLGSHDLTAHH
jgi:proton-dependent oligopeptide transporter, POT family